MPATATATAVIARFNKTTTCATTDYENVS
jgi:hypothetical protein